MKSGKPIALVACDKFKGSLDAIQACSAVQRGLGEAWQVDLCPVADGGEGFVSTMVAAMNGTLVRACSASSIWRPGARARCIIQSVHASSIACEDSPPVIWAMLA